MRRKQKKKPVTQKTPVRWTKDDCGGAGPHTDKRRKGNKKQRIKKIIQEQLDNE